MSTSVSVCHHLLSEGSSCGCPPLTCHHHRVILASFPYLEPPTEARRAWLPHPPHGCGCRIPVYVSDCQSCPPYPWETVLSSGVHCSYSSIGGVLRFSFFAFGIRSRFQVQITRVNQTHLLSLPHDPCCCQLDI